jgi:hypothetical protein
MLLTLPSKTTPRNFLSTFWKKQIAASSRSARWIVAGFFLVLALRIIFCAQAPIETTDLYRHLGFTSHFLENPKGFYWLVPEDFPDEFWSDFWGEVPYLYPPVALLFFAFFGTLGIGLFWVKLALTLCDLGTAVLIGRASSWWGALLVFSAPASVWYTSHEGQYESLVTLLMVFSIFSMRLGRWKLAGAAFLLALQTKQLAIMIAPYLLFEIFNRIRPKQLRAAKGFLIGFGVALLPFLPFYYWRPNLWLLPLQNQGNLLNPFFWPFFCSNASMAHFDECSDFRALWNALVSFAPLALMALFLAHGHFRRKFPQSLPTIGFWVMIKSAAWVMNWYMLLLPACSFTLWRYRRCMIALLVIFWLQCGQQVASIIGDIRIEEPATIARFQQCIWRADYRFRE